MVDTGHKLSGAIVAAAVAGPVFLTGHQLTALYLTMPDAIVVEAQQLAIFAAMLVPALIIGFLLSLIPHLICVEAVARLADRHPGLRWPPAWSAIGLMLGVGIAIPLVRLGGEPELAVAALLASTVSARIARAFLRWDEPWTDRGVIVSAR